MMPRRASILLPLSACLLLGVSCAREQPPEHAAEQAPEQAAPPNEAALTSDQPETTLTMIDEPALEVLWLAGQGPTGPLYNGSEPDTDAAFDALAALGVLTIISVDGAKPDEDRAAARGMRYVHLPIGYDGVNEADRVQIAAAVRDLPGPIYIHCHHGKHRSPAAAAAALVSLGNITTNRANSMLEFAGTSEAYTGLWRDVAACTPLADDELDAIDTASLPAHAEPTGQVEAMVAIDRAFDNLKAIARAGWRVPADHPDLVPAAEAGRLADLFRVLIDHEETAGYPADFGEMLRSSTDHATVLEAVLKSALVEDHAETATASFTAIRNDCKSCHQAHRNK